MNPNQTKTKPVIICYAIFLMLAGLLAGCAHTPGQPVAGIPSPVLISWPADKPFSPSELPGNGLDQHDFFYAGEAHAERMSIVRDGKVIWSYTHPAEGEISDATWLPNGNVLFAHQHGVTEINADKQVIWNYDAPANTEIHTVQSLGKNRLFFIQNGNLARLIFLNKVSGKAEREFVLPVGSTNSIHGQCRHARLTTAGTLLVAHQDLGKVVEYDMSGKALWSLDVPGAWSASLLKNGNVLVASYKNFVREFNRRGEVVWEWIPADAPDYKIFNLQLATRLPNGNTLINNWVNEWSDKIDPTNAPVQALEVTPDKKVVWVLRSWSEPANLGPATTIQILNSR